MYPFCIVKNSEQEFYVYEKVADSLSNSRLLSYRAKTVMPWLDGTVFLNPYTQYIFSMYEVRQMDR